MKDTDTRQHTVTSVTTAPVFCETVAAAVMRGRVSKNILAKEEGETNFARCLPFEFDRRIGLVPTDRGMQKRVANLVSSIIGRLR